MVLVVHVTYLPSVLFAALAPVLLLELAQAYRFVVQVALDRQVQGTTCFLQFAQREIAQLNLEANHEANEQILAVELRRVPGAPGIRREVLDTGQRVETCLLV